ncbi:M28 family peptidase [Microcoleus sp. FACHB-831]|uniref:M28 family peptidase n=1 Tax=Microcoleus sp. FACHB-831 TaxID=2692827 RepID=UPI001686B8C0|nr:M28 family peptidase [Microcoleus sp. FACHB-831]MBD1922400.1 M28 family peptidase [Microcoleus sp. FACHB-831]
MRKWIWLALLVLLTAGVVVGNKFLQPPEEPAIAYRMDSISDIAAAQAAPLLAPYVDENRLMAHIQGLNYKRYTPTERDRARTYITQSLKKLGFSPKLEQFEGGGANIIATRQGTNPEAGTVLIAAHYDTVSASPGADDNASGVAVVLEVARLFGSRPTPRTLQLALFDLEERGLFGSLAFTAKAANLENLRGAIVMDMVGYACYTPGCQSYPEGLPVKPPTDKGDFLAVIGDAEHLPLIDAFQKASGSNLPPVLTVPIPFKGMLTPDVLRSDHAPFWLKNVGAVLLTDTANMRTPHYHQASDTPKTIDRAFFKGAAQIVANAATSLLEGSDRLETQSSTSP